MDKDDRIIDVESGSDASYNMSDEEVIYTEETPKNISAEDNVTTDINKEEKIDAKKKIHLSVYDLVSVVMSSFIIIAIIFTFVFRLVGVDGLSMTNTLQDGDWLLTVQKSEYEYGDIVVITQDTYFHEPLIKRVIATGGQTVDIDYETATIYVDGTALEEPYVKEDFLLKKGDYREFPYTVPEGHLFCMGDNRNGSTDSRSYHVGDIDERYILGKAVVRILPVGDFDIYDYE